MKHLVISIFALHFSLLALSAAVPLRWTVETSSANPATFDQFAGATYDLEAALQIRGKPLAVDGEAQLFWQTNGMGSAWWSAPATVSGNVLRATWTPACDVGAKAYNCFIGITGTVYNAAFQLRLRPSPGATPNALPLPTPVIDFAKVTVLNPPWSGGGSGGVNTNAVIDIVHKTVDGAARMLPRYLHSLDFADSYPDAAAEYYRSRGDGKADGGCSAVRDGGFLYRNFDYPFDERAEFVVKMSAGAGRFASVGVAQVGTNLTEAIVTSGKPNRCYKWLPGATVDGINEHGVVCEINVVDGEPPASTDGDIHPLGAVRWALDNGTSAEMVATNLAARIAFPVGWAQNFHWMIADERETWIVEGGTAYPIIVRPVLTNFRIAVEPPDGPGIERYNILMNPASSITNAWYTRAYRRETNPIWASDLAEVIAYTNDIFDAWAAHDKEYFRGQLNGGKPWWQSIHTSIYDITNRTLRVAVQETDDWYTFAVPSAGGVKPEAVKEIVEPMVGDATNALDAAKRDKTDLKVYADGFSDWTYRVTGEITTQEELLSRGGGLHPYQPDDPNGPGWYYNDFGTNPIKASSDTNATEVSYYFGFSKEEDEDEHGCSVVATRSFGKIETGDVIATTNDISQAKADMEEDETDRQIVRGLRTSYLTYEWDITVRGAESADYVPWDGVYDTPTTISGYGIEDGATKDELDAKRNLTDNTCRKTEYTLFVYESDDPNCPEGWVETANSRAEHQPHVEIDDDGRYYYWVRGIGGYMSEGTYGTELGFRDFFFVESEPEAVGFYATAVRSRVCTSNETFVTQSFVTNAVKTLAPAPGNYAAVSNAAMSAISQVTNADANLIYTITSDGAEPRFYFTPVGAINPED